ncbi:hypothetical protein AK812_SmicGene7428 [Symbiodinium microadriaticum]|uniref:Uncharacterized protein n=1 Tax=Symbiodinium microadriaticum TaxID=2951 RepID=A0A1Q9ENM8_SYMMI|nr:hypothetical protein AK812_SmicGene7428 [Symbiodinium microadriaticum]CAE7906642.1 unnamed protein product [Symbiodinium microadriaticum]
MSFRRLLKVPRTPKKKGVEQSATPPKVKKSRKRPLDGLASESIFVVNFVNICSPPSEAETAAKRKRGSAEIFRTAWKIRKDNGSCRAAPPTPRRSASDFVWLRVGVSVVVTGL